MQRILALRPSRANVRGWAITGTMLSVGALFLRSYERGERVHLAMLSRGYTGTMPAFTTASASTATWAVALVPAVAAANRLHGGPPRGNARRRVRRRPPRVDPTASKTKPRAVIPRGRSGSAPGCRVQPGPEDPSGTHSGRVSTPHRGGFRG